MTLSCDGIRSTLPRDVRAPQRRNEGQRFRGIRRGLVLLERPGIRNAASFSAGDIRFQAAATRAFSSAASRCSWVRSAATSSVRRCGLEMKSLLEALLQVPRVALPARLQLRHRTGELEGIEWIRAVDPSPQRAAHEPQRVGGAASLDLAVAELHPIDHGLHEALVQPGA